MERENGNNRIKYQHLNRENNEIVNAVQPDNEGNNSFEQFVKNMLGPGLGLDGTQLDAIYTELLRFDDSTKYEIMQNTALNSLIENDIEIRKLGEEGGLLHSYLTQAGNESLSSQWTTFKKHIAKLQALVILKRVKTGTGKEVIEALIKAFTDKIENVNSILEQNLREANEEFQRGGNMNSISDESKFKNKYWKYKFKYELLKKEKEAAR